jgi:penicillin amidase/acyl-homoserine-lactone acylase
MRLAVVVGVASLLLVPAAGATSPETVAAAEGPRAATAGPYKVRIRRDEFGVPHVLGETDAAAAYGLGFAQSEDDFVTVQESIMTARGRQALLKGPDGAPSDVLFAHLRVREVVEAGYERDLSPHLRGVLEAYAAGVNRYAALHPELVSPHLLPVTGRDLVAFTVFRGPSFYGLDGVFIQAATGKLPVTAEEIGSNAVAVAPSRSADGRTRLLFNAHQPWTGPLTWYEAVVQSGEGWHVAGGFFPANPFMLGGHNGDLGWAATVNHPKLHDVYKLAINPANPNQYRLDGAWRDLERRVVEIPVRQADGTVRAQSREILRSVHGPVVKGPQGVFAIRYPTQGGVRQVSQNWAMNRAATLEDWQAAMRMQAVPSINYLYADKRGNIGYLSNGMYPLRKDGAADWSKVVPGDRSDLIWTQLRPFSASPQIWNPKSGWLFNANNTPFRATDPDSDLRPEAFPDSQQLQPLSDMTNRAWRALEVYGADPSITAAEFDAYKYDLGYSARSEAAAWVKAVLSADAAGDPDLQAAQRTLAAWDGQAGLKSRGTALVALMWLQRRAHPDWTPLQMVQGAIPILKKGFGRVDPEWGEVNRLRRGDLDIPVDGGPDTFRALYGSVQPDGRLRGVNGDAYVMFVEWDRRGRVSSRSVHQFGAATSVPQSPHYADQAPMFAAHRTKPVRFTEAELAGHITRDYSPNDPAAVVR